MTVHTGYDKAGGQKRSRLDDLRHVRVHVTAITCAVMYKVNPYNMLPVALSANYAGNRPYLSSARKGGLVPRPRT